MSYSTIVADPPWPIKWTPGSDKIRGGAWWKDGDNQTKGGLELAYETMSLGELADLPVANLAADDSALFLWATRKFFREGEASTLARAWGFEPCGEIIWGLRSPGLGTGPFKNGHEPILVARRGKHRFEGKSALGVYFWKQVYGHNGKVPYKIHSAKPEAFQDLVEQISPGPYLELFARRKRSGWHVWGNEVECDVELAS